MNELELTLQWVAGAAAGRVIAGNPERAIGAVTTDTRTLGTGDFFVALKGPRYDGHDFVAEALNRGAAGVLVTDDWFERHGSELSVSQAGGPGVVAVTETTTALQDMARQLRRRVPTRVVAITGSAGKTTTKESIASMLATRLRVVKNRGNLNNHIGLPLSLMELRTRPDVAVMELGMNHRGEISTLVGIADPDVRVWTNVGDAHLGFFASPEEIADAKAEILEQADASDVLVCNADDTRVMARTSGFPGRTITFGYSPSATVRAVDVEDGGVAGMKARMTTPSGERVIETALLGRGNLANLLAASAVALDAGVPLDTVAEQIALARPADRRGAVHRAGGLTIIDDSYNSSPSALAKALDVLRRDQGAARKIAVLGEMLELGEHAERLHRAAGGDAASCSLAMLVAVGDAGAAALADGAIGAGLSPTVVHHVRRADAAAELVAAHVRPGDLVLVKGSRGIRTDLIVDRLLRGAV